MKQLFYKTIVLFLIPISILGQMDSLTPKLEKIEQLGYLPGFAVAIVSKDGVLYKKGFGYADLESKRPYTTNSLQNIGSISKTLTGLCLLKLVEEGKLKLDTPINNFLTTNLYNPYHPKVPITIEHLANHTSSIIDPDEYEHTYLFSKKIDLTENQIPEDMKEYVSIYNKNQTMPVIDFVESMIHPLGKWYSKKNFSRKKPGTQYNYSNMGAAIAGHIIEQITGKTYLEYTQEVILNPFKMTQSGWKHRDVNMDQFVSLYLSNNQKIPPYELISYADGGLITNVSDMGLYLSEMIKGYHGGASNILSSDSFQQLLHPKSIADERYSGIFWQTIGSSHIGHTGGDPGIMAIMSFEPKTGYGYIVFTNKTDNDGDGYNQLVHTWKTMQEFMKVKMNKTNP